jgi:hypothetical protein
MPDMGVAHRKVGVMVIHDFFDVKRMIPMGTIRSLIDFAVNSYFIIIN